MSPQNDSSALPDTTGVEQDEVYTYYEKVYADPADSIFWYGFGQGTVQFFANVNTSLGAYLSDWLCHAWDAITSQYELALHSDAVYSEEDIEAMRNAGLSEEEIIEITGCEVDKNGEFMLECENSKSQEDFVASEGKMGFAKANDNSVIVIPSNPDEKTRIDYDLTYYVNDINTANTQVLMTYGRNQTEKAVYVYGEGRIAEDDLQTDETSEYLYDGRGSVVQTTIEAQIDMSLTYDPFGEITSGVDVNFVGYAYNGEESNEVTGLQYLRARYYDTELGSFITIDSYLGSLDDAITQNRYTYANNDPINNIDPSGHYSVNVNGTYQYYQPTGLNELRDYMTAAALWAGDVTAQSGFNSAVARASNTDFMNYQSITGISQSTANNYINDGIAQAGQVSMNYGCSVPTVPNQAVAKFANNVNSAKNSANARISSIKAQKKVQYDEYQYQLYLKQLEEQQQALKTALQDEAKAFFKEHFGQDFTAENVIGLSKTQQTQFLDYLAKSISVLLPNLSIDGLQSIEIPLGSGTTIYYKISATGNYYGADNADIDVNLEIRNQKLVFDSFSASTGIQGLEFGASSDDLLSYSVSNEFGANTATIKFEVNPFENKTAIEYSVTTDLEYDISVSSRIGVETTNSQEPPTPFPQPATENVPQPVIQPVPIYYTKPEITPVEVIVGIGIIVWAVASPDPVGEVTTATYWASLLGVK